MYWGAWTTDFLPDQYTMVVYRIIREKFRHDALSTLGTRYSPKCALYNNTPSQLTNASGENNHKNKQMHIHSFYHSIIHSLLPITHSIISTFSDKSSPCTTSAQRCMSAGTSS
jgi:hypothetical protein